MTRQAVAQTEERPLWEREAAGSIPASLTNLDPGIRRTVAMLRDAGFRTVDSGDGTKRGPGTIPRPHVVCVVDPMALVSEAHRLLAVICHRTSARIPETVAIEATYSPIDGVATLTLLGVKDEDVN